MMRSPSATRDETHWWAQAKNIFDWSLRKEFALTETQRLEFRAEFFNALNHPNFSQPDNFIDDDTRGRHPVIAIPMRQIQFGLKYRSEVYFRRRTRGVARLGGLVRNWWTKLSGSLRYSRGEFMLLQETCTEEACY